MVPGEALRNVLNVGHASPARIFPGFHSSTDVETTRVGPRGAVRVPLMSGDLISLAPSGGVSEVAMVAFDPNGDDGLVALGIKATTIIGEAEFDSKEMVNWVTSRGRTASGFSSSLLQLQEHKEFRATSEVTVWVVQPEDRTAVVEGQTQPHVSILIKRSARSGPLLPEPMGDIRDEFTVSRGTARAYAVEPGEIIQIIDVEGQQCSDFMAFRSDGLDAGHEWMIDSTATRSMVRQAYPTPGLLDKFFDREMRPMLRVVQDTCGRHDTFGLACTARGYEERGFPGHLNCSDNISAAMQPYGVARRSAWPAINFFWNTWVDPQTQLILTEESHSRPGDYVAMEALSDLVCVSTACPDDIDPINGWNPTDVHVRIYKPETRLQRAVAYRVKEDAPMAISRGSAFHPRTSSLTQHFAPARDLWAPVSYPSVGTIGEYWACREGVTVQDMSGLRKYDIIGPDAETLLQRALTKDIAKLANWRGTYALMCDDTGCVIDDGTLFRLAPDLFRWCCGTEESARTLEAVAEQEGLQVRLTDMSDALVNLALQGPKSRELLDGLAFTQPHVPSLDQIKWFGVTIARLKDREGAPFMLSRTGYTGELGYEIFCAPTDALRIWDAVMGKGQDLGITPMGSAALEIIRIEAGLAAAGAEFAPSHDAFEAGLGFAVNLNKSEFRGKAALERNARNPRKALKGLTFDCQDVPPHGAPVFAGERQIGQITSAARSPMFEATVAMARLAVEHAETGTKLEVGMLDGRMKRLPAVVVDIPFFDPKRERARA